MSFGMPRSARSCFWIRRTGASDIAESTTKSGMNPNIFALSRIVICGAWAALAKRFRISPTRRGSGSVRWKQPPSRPFLWAMWSIASTTKSTGTRLMRPPSMPTVGIHCGRALRIFWMSLKK